MQTSPAHAATLTQAVLLAQDGARTLSTIAGKPVLTWKMRELQRFGVTDFIVLGVAEGLAQAELDHAALGLPKPAQLRFGPAGNWAAIIPHLNDRFLLSSADLIFDANIALLLRDFARDPPDAAGRALMSMRGTAPSGAFAGTWALSRTHLVAAAAVAAPAAALPETAAPGFLADLRTQAGRHAAAHDLPAILARPSLMLDRDGVLNRDHGYVGRKENWDWTPGAREAVKLATDHGWHVFVVTNQSGVARGLYSEDAVRDLHLWMSDQIRLYGGTVDDTRYCPYHPDATVAAYRRESDWRKPGPGMILNLIADWALSPQHCVLVGDQDTDMKAAEAAGIAGVLFDGVNLQATVAAILMPEASGGRHHG